MLFVRQKGEKHVSDQVKTHFPGDIVGKTTLAAKNLLDEVEAESGLDGGKGHLYGK
jgi:hypothetical protein